MKVVRLDTGADWDQTTVATEDADELDVAIAELEQLKDFRDKALKRYKDVEAKVMALMDSRSEKTHISPYDGGWQATKVQGERIKIDEDKLLARVGDKADYITKRVFDKAKLEHAVSLGLIDGDVVSDCATVEHNAPYLRLTRHREQEPEEHDTGTD